MAAFGSNGFSQPMNMSAYGGSPPSSAAPRRKTSAGALRMYGTEYDQDKQLQSRGTRDEYVNYRAYGSGGEFKGSAADPQVPVANPVQADDQQFKSWMSAAKQNRTLRPVGYNEAADEAEGLQQWNQWTPQQRDFYGQRAQDAAKRMQALEAANPVFARLNGRDPDFAAKVEAEKQRQEWNAKRTAAAPGAERYGVEYDQKATGGAQQQTREDYVAGRLKEEQDKLASQKADSDKFESAKSKYQRPAGMSDSAFDYLVRQKESGNREWDAPSYQTWRELQGRPQFASNAYGESVSPGTQQQMSNDMNMYQQFSMGHPGGTNWSGFRKDSDWKPFEGLLNNQSGMQPRSSAGQASPVMTDSSSAGTPYAAPPQPFASMIPSNSPAPSYVPSNQAYTQAWNSVRPQNSTQAYSFTLPGQDDRGNLAYAPDAYRPPAFQAQYQNIDGSYSDKPNFALRDALIDRLNSAQSLNPDIQSMFGQAQQMVNNGWQNPFSQQSMFPGAQQNSRFDQSPGQGWNDVVRPYDTPADNGYYGSGGTYDSGVAAGWKPAFGGNSWMGPQGQRWDGRGPSPWGR